MVDDITRLYYREMVRHFEFESQGASLIHLEFSAFCCFFVFVRNSVSIYHSIF